MPCIQPRRRTSAEINGVNGFANFFSSQSCFGANCFYEIVHAGFIRNGVEIAIYAARFAKGNMDVDACHFDLKRKWILIYFSLSVNCL
jgi:hypothetical protein